MATNIDQGLTVDGVPVFGGAIPPITGNYFHVCPGSSTILNYKGKQVISSANNSGESIYAPLDSIATAYTKCTSGAGDGIVLWSYGTTTAQTTSYLTTPITWSKHGITTVGVCAPVRTSQRARITNSASYLALANLITVSGNNNMFLNFQLANFGSDAAALGGLDVTGYRNFFGNVHAAGAGNTTPAQLTGSYSLKLTGAQENTFVGCTFGLNTVDQDGSQAATGVIKFASDCQDNYFEKCRVLSYYSYASATSGAIHHVGAGDSISRTHEFRDCSFINYKAGLPTTTPPLSLVVGTAPNNGVIWMTGTTNMLGYAAYDSVAANDRVYNSVAASNATGGLAVVTA